MRTWAVAAALAAALCIGGAAEAAPSPLGQACGKDIKSLCGKVKPGRDALKACVEFHYKELSADCQVAIVRAAAVGRACRSDLKTLCAKARNGEARTACLKKNETSLSAPCKDALSKAGDE